MHHISIVPALDDAAIAPEIEAQMRHVIEAAIAHEALACDCDVYVMLTDDAGIRALNEEHRGIDRATDVLSFPMQEITPGEPFTPSPLELDPETQTCMLGDIVISVSRASAQAEEYGHSLARELCFLAAHAAFHLLGYDHEKSEEDERVHFALQEEILTACGIPRESK